MNVLRGMINKLRDAESLHERLRSSASTFDPLLRKALLFWHIQENWRDPP